MQTKTLAARLEEWRETEPRQIEVKEVRQNPALQPRNMALLSLRDQARQEAQSEEHIERMTGVLRLSAAAELEPLLVASIAGELFVTDGHHRLRAYQRAGRARLPARVRVMDWRTAGRLSRLVNLDGVKLPMHRDQLREQAWQHLAGLTAGGSLKLPPGSSERSIALEFGISRDTVARMLARLPEVDPERYPKDHRDGASGFPQWRYVRHTIRNGLRDEMTPGQYEDWRIGKLQRQVARYAKDLPRELVAVALRGLLADVEAEPEEGAAGVPEVDRRLAEAIDRGEW
ncbi:MAG TPA: ParB/RepB/Spo0J family partition protein [Luteimonas sp.]|nr:ParB/RepB/Spo0J family partition protein [Luteimonas sp.]